MLAANEIRTARLLLRPWVADDAAALLPVLEANRSHLKPWIPARVSEPAPLPVLAERLAAFAADFAADREWRYALLSPDDGRVLGEVSLFPRSSEGRVPFTAADRAEIGYWLRADVTGRGLASEAAQAMVDLALTMPALRSVEIRCDARNAASGAVPRRLGFALTETVRTTGVAGESLPVALQVWTRPLVNDDQSESDRARTRSLDSVSLMVDVRRYRFEDDGVIPNSVLPVMVYRQVCAAEDASTWLEQTFARNGWTNNWHDVVLRSDHFHSNTHEVLGVGRGSVSLKVGGAAGLVIDLSAGDVVILPAGVGHYAVSTHTDYEMVGGYPFGHSWDMRTGLTEERAEVLANLSRVDLAETDPVFGAQGPLLESWHCPQP